MPVNSVCLFVQTTSAMADMSVSCDDEDDDEEYHAIYEQLWDVIGGQSDKDESGRPVPKPRPIKYKIDDFTFLKVLGKGSFGKVRPSLLLMGRCSSDDCAN